MTLEWRLKKQMRNTICNVAGSTKCNRESMHSKACYARIPENIWCVMTFSRVIDLLNSLCPGIHSP